MLKMQVAPGMCMKTKDRCIMDLVDPGILLKIKRLLKNPGEAGIYRKRKEIDRRSSKIERNYCPRGAELAS
jgi:hypothetical protein